MKVSKEDRDASQAYAHYDAMRNATFDAFLQDAAFIPSVKFHPGSGRVDLTLIESATNEKMRIPLGFDKHLSIEEQLLQSTDTILSFATAENPLAQDFVHQMCSSLEKRARDERKRQEELERRLDPDKYRREQERQRKRDERRKRFWGGVDKAFKVADDIQGAWDRYQGLRELTDPLSKYDGTQDVGWGGPHKVRTHTRRTADGDTIHVNEYERR